MTSFRESLPFYIGSSEQDQEQMLATLGISKLDELYQHIDENVKFNDSFELHAPLSHPEIKQKLEAISQKNKIMLNFIGDGLPQLSPSPIIGPICSIRGLTTAYTPYQPERSQGTLQSLWIYQSLMSMITGFEAVNASLYERATALFEGLATACRHTRKNTVLVAPNIFPGDLEVLKTQTAQTKMKIEFLPLTEQGQIDLEKLTTLLAETEGLAGMAFPQINTFGELENVNELTTLAHQHGLLAIGIVDPLTLANNGLLEPASWGEQGADILVGEAQHLTLDNNFGGPGLGLFAVRINDKNRNLIRCAPGRFVGRAKDESGRECKVIVLSTREQHIRREKATSNICSNQSFVASLCGATLLEKGSIGLSESFLRSHTLAQRFANYIEALPSVELLNTHFVSEITVDLTHSPVKADALIAAGLKTSMQIGVDISDRLTGKNLLKIAFHDLISDDDFTKLLGVFNQAFDFSYDEQFSYQANLIPSELKRNKLAHIPKLEMDSIINYYQELGEQNLSPDEALYPLGSCTMKYNPEINDWAAALPGFTQLHPQAPVENSQGALQVLFECQEIFKKITGLPGVTCQPVAGAQGELVGIKLFQAYFEDAGDHQRDVIIIPRSAHGTNPATAATAGFETKMVDSKKVGIISLGADEQGEINFAELETIVSEYQTRILGVMVTNPNTSGIFERQFKKMADLIHSVGGFVYMDGANMNAIAGIVDLGKLGVDAVHNNLHKTWSIPHGGGGPGDGMVAVSEKLIPFLPGYQYSLENGVYSFSKPSKSIGSFHRHHGNFAHKVRAYTYLMALGEEGVRKMSSVAVLSARYLYQEIKQTYPILPKMSEDNQRMHEFIVSFPMEVFKKAEEKGIQRSQFIGRVGKLFLDFGFHAPTVAFPEALGLMIEPTESYSKKELDEFIEMVKQIFSMVVEHPEVLKTVPHFTPIDRVNEASANKQLDLHEEIGEALPSLWPDRIDNKELRKFGFDKVKSLILEAHQKELAALMQNSDRAGQPSI